MNHSRGQPPKLDSDQLRVSVHVGGPLLVLAGPGTGKTTTLVEGILHKITPTAAGGAGLLPDRVLALTFGRRAAAEMRSRLASRIGDGALPLATTFHSFAYGVVRRAAAARGEEAPALLTAPEQERSLRENFLAAVRERLVDWPASLNAALATRGLAVEVREFIAGAQLHGLTGADLRAAVDAGGPSVWSALARFLDQYLDLLDAETALDYVELINRAALEVAAAPEPMFDAVFVDEYQDTDPGQVRMLKEVVRPGTTLVVVGDPDQAIYRFRGADVTGVREFADRFRGPDGAQAQIEVLRTSRRFGNVIRDAARRVIEPVSLAGLPAWAQREHRKLATEATVPPGDVSIVEFATRYDHASGVAELVAGIMAEEDSRRWSDVAVLVRSGVRDLPALANALAASGVPTAVPGDDLLLRDDPGIAPVLQILRIAAGALEPQAADWRSLAESPLANVSALEWRALARTLRDRALAGVAEGATQATARGEDLLASELAQAAPLEGIEAPGVAGLQELVGIVRRVRTAAAGEAPVPDLLWLVWSATSWPAELERQALAGGRVGRASDRILDAAVAMFDLAGRVGGSGVAGLRGFLAAVEEQAIPGGNESIRPIAGDRVTLLTAHRAKGLEWPVVVVAGVQEGEWPDVRRRSSLLQSDRLAEIVRGAPAIDPADFIADERRLFYVACTRARERLVIACVRSPSDSGDQPSRLVAECSRVPGVSVVPAVDVAAGAPTTVAGVLAELRLAAADSNGSFALRGQARRLLEDLARGVLPGQSLVPPRVATDGALASRPWTVSDVPVIADQAAARFSGSTWTALGACPLQWFLSRHVNAGRGTASSAAFGSLIHALADGLARGEVPASEDALMEVAAEFWPHLGFEAEWQSEAEFAEFRAAVARLLAWQSGRPERTPLGSEVPFEVTVASAAGPILIRGRVDRLESGPDGVHVVDLKTQRQAEHTQDLEHHRQMQAYQLALDLGGFGETAVVAGSPPSVAGAELVLLRLGPAGSEMPKIQTQAPIDREAVIADLVSAVDVIRAERFVPDPEGGACRTCEFVHLCPAGPAKGRAGR